jgi:hypothetical protein
VSEASMVHWDPQWSEGSAPHGIRPSMTSHFQVRFTAFHGPTLISAITVRWRRQALDFTRHRLASGPHGPRTLPRQAEGSGRLAYSVPDPELASCRVSSLVSPAVRSAGQSKGESADRATGVRRSPPARLTRVSVSFVSLLAILHRIWTRWRAAGAHRSDQVRQGRNRIRLSNPVSAFAPGRQSCRTDSALHSPSDHAV